MKRNLPLCKLGAMVISALESPFLHVENKENLPDESAIYAVKHQSFRDMWCMGVALYQTRGASAYYPMKAGLPDWFGLIGGIKIYRSEDIKHLIKKAKTVDAEALLKRDLRAKTEKAFKTLSNILANDDVNSSIIICPEGHRYAHGVGPLRRTGINMLLTAQSDARDIPIVPVGTEYQGKSAYLRIGKPRTYRTFTEQTAQEFRKELAALSNCPVLEEITSQTEQARVS